MYITFLFVVKKTTWPRLFLIKLGVLQPNQQYILNKSHKIIMVFTPFIKIYMISNKKKIHWMKEKIQIGKMLKKIKIIVLPKNNNPKLIVFAYYLVFYSKI